MPIASALAFLMAAIMAAMTCGTLGAGAAHAQTLDKVSFGTNWVAEAEHGGFYQALADGTYTWNVQTWNSIGYGPVSASMSFTNPEQSSATPRMASTV